VEALKPALEQTHEALTEQERLLEERVQTEQAFERDWPMEFNMRLAGGGGGDNGDDGNDSNGGGGGGGDKAPGKKKKSGGKKKASGGAAAGGGGEKGKGPPGELSHYDILNATKMSLQTKIDGATAAGERDVVNSLLESQRDIQREMARLRQENMVHRCAFADWLACVRACMRSLPVRMRAWLPVCVRTYASAVSMQHKQQQGWRFRPVFDRQRRGRRGPKKRQVDWLDRCLLPTSVQQASLFTSDRSVCAFC
jgi:hypothetical protein